MNIFLALSLLIGIPYGYTQYSVSQIEKKPIYRKLSKNLDKWIIKNGYDLKKVKIMTGLIFLNIAALHHNPYSKFLYYLGKDLIYREIYEKN